MYQVYSFGFVQDIDEKANKISQEIVDYFVPSVSLDETGNECKAFNFLTV